MRSRKLLLILWLLLLPLLVAALFCPLRLGLVRLTVTACVLGLWSGGLALGYSRKPVRILCIAFALLTAGLFLPGRPAAPDSLQAAYTTALRHYEGTPYVWGGGNRQGIDCSGLVSQAMIDADLNVGLRTANPRLIREGLSLWWHPCTAEVLGKGYEGRTRQLLTTPSLNALDGRRLIPGDIAVTTGGGHTMAYLGNHTWIEADPNLLYGDKVILVETPTRNAWFREPMCLMRWRQFEGS